jgi:hypothetical protein
MGVNLSAAFLSTRPETEISDAMVTGVSDDKV